MELDRVGRDVAQHDHVEGLELGERPGKVLDRVVIRDVRDLVSVRSEPFDELAHADRVRAGRVRRKALDLDLVRDPGLAGNQYVHDGSFLSTAPKRRLRQPMLTPRDGGRL